MSIPVLVQVYDEVRRLAIAGSMVAPGDFRLKKLASPLEQAGKKAPVFAKVAEAVNRLVESKEQTSASALLDLATLINSILYTQGETGLEGEIAPLKMVELGRFRTQAPARMLKPLQEALSSTGSGRVEIIRDGLDRGAFRDLRMVAPALAALDDGYAEIADLVADKILPLYGTAIFSELEAGFDPKGRGGQVRRLRLMHRLDPGAARPHVKRSLEEGSPEVRITAIGCLGDSPDDLAFLMEQAKARAKDVRAAAFKALGRCGADEAARTLSEAIRSEALTLAVEPLKESRHPAVAAALLDAAEGHFNALLAGKEKDVAKLGKQNDRMGLFLQCLAGRDDPRTETLLLTMFGAMKPLAAIKGMPSGKDVIEQLVSVMAEGPPAARSALIDERESLPPEHFGLAFDAARNSRMPAEVFDLFSPYLAAGAGEKKKGRDPSRGKRAMIFEHLLQAATADASNLPEPGASAGLDGRWLDLAVRLDEAGLVQALAVPGHTGANEFLARRFRAQSGRSGTEYEMTETIDAMIRVRHPGATDAVIELIRRIARGKASYGYYGISYWLGRLISRLPRAEALPKLEALLPSLPEAMIDRLLDSMNELKQAEPTPTTT